MDLWRSLNGMLNVEILSADPKTILALIHKKGIVMEYIRFIDELTVQFMINRQDFRNIHLMVSGRGESLKVVGKKGIFWKANAFVHRPVLITGIVLFIILSVWLPTRIYFFEVEGNIHVPKRQILEIASQSGISFGTSRREVRSEKVKNALLQNIPQLEWVGINTAGCVATISVRERQSGTLPEPKPGVSSIVAIRDGVVESITVTSGSAAVKKGQAVKAGQILISGYTDCGFSIRATRARGEIYASTNHKFSCVISEKRSARGSILSKTKNCSIIIGKKRINFYQGSGILDTSCVKMYEENYVTLPGGFRLPIVFVTETCIYYEQSPPTASIQQIEDNLAHFAEQYLRSQMVAGQIRTKAESFAQSDGVYRLDGEYECFEIIGKERNEEIIGP